MQMLSRGETQPLAWMKGWGSQAVLTGLGAPVSILQDPVSYFGPRWMAFFIGHVIHFSGNSTQFSFEELPTLM